jgi:hypothetical protein
VAIAIEVFQIAYVIITSIIIAKERRGPLIDNQRQKVGIK